MYETFAPSFTQNTLASARVISTGSIHIYGIVIANDDNSNIRTVTLEKANGDTYMVIVLPANSTFESDIKWLADNGLTVDIDVDDADVTFTVFHSNTAGAA